MFYLFIFLVSVILFKHAQNAYEDGNKRLFYTFSYTAIIWLSLWAGLRDHTIGTDTLIYGLDVFNESVKSKNIIADAFDDISWIEPFYFILNKFASYFGGFGVALFCIMFVQLIFVFYGMKLFIAKVPIWLLMMAYFFLFYNLTLNLMRQGIAIAFVLFCYRYVEKRRLVLLLLMSLLGFCWHKSSAVGFLFLFILYFYIIASVRFQRLFLIIAIPILLFGVLSFLTIWGNMMEADALLSHYSNYGGENGEMEAGLSTVDLISRFLLFMLSIYLWHYKSASNLYFNIFCLILMFDLACKFMGIYTYNITRLSYYFMVLEIPYIYMTIRSSISLSKYHQTIVSAFVCACFAFMTFWNSFYYGFNETYPYVLGFWSLSLY